MGQAQWIEEITIQQELMKPGQAEDSRVLSEQLSQQTTLQEQHAAHARGLQELRAWLSAAEDALAERPAAPGQGGLPALQQRQSSVKELQRSMHSRAASFAGVLKSTEQFLEGNKVKMEPRELAAPREKLWQAKKPVSSDPAVLQKQLASANQLQGDLAEHQVLVEKLQKAARSLLEIQGEPAPDHGRVQETTDAIVSRFQSLSQQMAERSDLLQKSIAQSQSVQESLESLLQSVAEIEKSLKEEQPIALSSASIQDSLATNAKLKQDIARQKSCLEATREMVTRFMETADGATASALQGKLAQVTEHFGWLCQQQQEDALKGLLPKVEQFEQLSEKLKQFTESRARMLATGNQPDHDIAHFSQHIQ
ncbi:PREDICTED: microtubule-actin cross-linking factor 1, isoforms 1/2/3/5-like, partial [Tinamus guttatus]|uniref:microtubule-actin cross-linking factor 1, isoforms 1/2/3/5-like n=1 Tax=Tinamus guttatus TaxID=94827 RepID=UPI00052F3A35